jgi:hypothetical protein
LISCDLCAHHVIKHGLIRAYAPADMGQIRREGQPHCTQDRPEEGRGGIRPELQSPVDLQGHAKPVLTNQIREGGTGRSLCESE